MFLVKNSIFGVINCQNIDIFAHIFGPLTNDPFIKNIEIAAKAQPGSYCLYDLFFEDRSRLRGRKDEAFE